MSPITRRDFQSALPLHPSVLARIEANYRAGWVDAGKIHHQSAKFRIELEDARQRIATRLGLDANEIEVVGEIGFGFWSALSGLMDGPVDLVYSEIDRQIIHAFARANEVRGGRNKMLSPNPSGAVDFTNLKPDSVLVWQGTNRECGIEQAPPMSGSGARIFADMTARFDPASLPTDWQVALWDPRSFAGPEGIAILGIRNGSTWRSPIPQIDQRRLFGSYSKPLLLATADALDLWSSSLQQRRENISRLNQLLRAQLAAQIPSLKIVGDATNSDPRFLAIVAPDLIAEEALRKMEELGILIDAGSACSAGALAPSHVLAALGMGSEGHLRFTLKEDQTEEDIAALATALSKVVADLAT